MPLPEDESCAKIFFMTLIHLNQYKVTRQFFSIFCLKVLAFLGALGWSLRDAFINPAQISFILFGCFLVVFFFYLLAYKKVISFERRALLCIGNFCLLGAAILMLIDVLH